MKLMKRMLLFALISMSVAITAPVFAQDKIGSSVKITLDAGVLKTDKKASELEYTIKHTVIASALSKGGYDTVGKLAKADLEKLATLIGKTKSVVKGKSTVTPDSIHSRAALEMAARLKDAAMNVVMSGGTTMFGETADAGTKISPDSVGRVFLNPSRTYKQLPDKY